jgi:hypothetical protein
MKRAPLSVWIARVILLLASFAFTILTAVVATSEARRAADFMYPVLLVILPVVGFAGLLRPAWWGRRVATLGLLCVWGVGLRALYVWIMYYSRTAFINNNDVPVLVLILTGFAVGIPLLLLRLYRGKAASSFFAK